MAVYIRNNDLLLSKHERIRLIRDEIRRFHENKNVLFLTETNQDMEKHFIEPNLLQANASYVVTDISGNLYKKYFSFLKAKSYEIKCLNFANPSTSDHYNPLAYLYTEYEVNRFVNYFFKCTRSEVEDEPIFLNTEKMLLSACILYLVKYVSDRDNSTLFKLMEMVATGTDPSDETNSRSQLDLFFEVVPEESIAGTYYRKYKETSISTRVYAAASCYARLQMLAQDSIKAILQSDDMKLEEVGDRKTVLFVIPPEGKTEYSPLITILFSQLFERIISNAERKLTFGASKRFRYPVNFFVCNYTDDDEQIFNLPKSIIAFMNVCHSYNFNVLLCSNDFQHIKDEFETDWWEACISFGTMVLLHIGESKKEFLHGLGALQELSNTFIGEKCCIYRRGQAPIFDKVFKVEKHPSYNALYKEEP